MKSIEHLVLCLPVKFVALMALMWNFMCFIAILSVIIFQCHFSFFLFFYTAKIPDSWGRTFVALISKKDNPIFVMDFRLISLCIVCYKVIAKLLPNCLRYVIHKLVSPEQNVLILGWGTYDSIIVAQEIAIVWNLILMTSLGYDFKNWCWKGFWHR